MVMVKYGGGRGGGGGEMESGGRGGRFWGLVVLGVRVKVVEVLGKFGEAVVVWQWVQICGWRGKWGGGRKGKKDE